jgi:hypothetical protein
LPCRNALGLKFLTAPRANDQIGLPRNYLVSCHNAVLGRALVATIGKNVDAAGDLDKLRNPPNSRNQRIVSLLEEYPR